MILRLVDKGWKEELDTALKTGSSEIRIICPFIKVSVINRFLSHHPSKVRVVTRFNLADFSAGVSDIESLRKLLDAGAKVRGLRNLHAKLYLFGASRMILTSANLTKAALNSNHELGIITEDAAIIAESRNYFDRIWQSCAGDLQSSQIDDWAQIIKLHCLSGGRPSHHTGLEDFGVDTGISEPPPMPALNMIDDSTLAFVKFLGEHANRVSLSHSSFAELDRSGCHWAVCYPKRKRPRRVKDNAVIYIGRMTGNPNDIRIFGRAIGIGFVEGRDDATPEDIRLRGWKNRWSRYIRVHHAEFLAGSMENGISLNELMRALRSDSFQSTQRHAKQGHGNTNPYHAYQQQPDVELSIEGRKWVEEKLQKAIEVHGKIPQLELNKLDWPTAIG